MTLAVRVWRWHQWDGLYRFGLMPGIELGDWRTLEERREVAEQKKAWLSVSRVIQIVLQVIFGTIALVLFWRQRGNREYLWFGLFAVSVAAIGVSEAVGDFYSLDLAGVLFTRSLIVVVCNFCQLFFYQSLLKGRRGGLYWFSFGCMVAEGLLTSGLFGLMVLNPDHYVLSFVVWTSVDEALSVGISIWILALLWERIREGRFVVKVLLTTAALQLLTNIFGYFLSLVGYGSYFGLPAFRWYDELIRWPFPVSLPDVAMALFLLAMLGILVDRFIRTHAQEEALEQEREAARTVQQMLIPQEALETPGFAVESVYKPFGEVGGDFYQVMPQGDGSLLIVIGDVSGKGLPAAMTVSMLVGTVRTLAHYTQSPGEILAAMNQRMLGRSCGGFTTCMMIWIAPHGRMVVANAGHLAPYLNGTELVTENGLPLGLASGADYAESTFELEADGQLTLITDGVLEARSKGGELFGFERVGQVASGTAEAIAGAAEAFGQDDDITVLTLRRVAVA